MNVAQLDVAGIADQVWSGMLGLGLAPSSVARHDPADRVVAGTVQITGDFHGAVTVRCSQTLALRAAAAMFGTDELDPAEVHDALGELANMTGGALKALLPGSCQLSLPTVSDGIDQHVTIPGSRVLDEVALDQDGELLVVTVSQGDGG